MRPITTPGTFKTCYIAQVKEELGFPVRKAPNRKGEARKIQVRKELRPFIEQAILILKEKTGTMPPYKQIQELSFELYCKSDKPTKSDRFFGIFKSDHREDVIRIAEDKDVYYDN